MSSLNDKEKAYEDKFAHDQEVAFRIRARSYKLFGLWGAEKMGHNAEKREEYARQLAEIRGGDREVIARVKKDLDAGGTQLTEHELQEHLYHCTQAAKRQIMGS
jgi:hypothetical protein